MRLTEVRQCHPPLKTIYKTAFKNRIHSHYYIVSNTHLGYTHTHTHRIRRGELSLVMVLEISFSISSPSDSDKLKVKKKV